MASYQFHLTVIPKKGVLEYFSEIPSKLELGFSKEKDDELDYSEMIQHKCWSLANINSKAIINELDQKLNRANWGNENCSNNWKIESKNLDIDAWVLENEKEIEIKEFMFRADLRQPKLKFLCEMIELSNKNEFFLFDIKGNLSEPKKENIIKLMEKSDAFKFVKSPIEFLNHLS